MEKLWQELKCRKFCGFVGFFFRVQDARVSESMAFVQLEVQKSDGFLFIYLSFIFGFVRDVGKFLRFDHAVPQPYNPEF